MVMKLGQGGDIDNWNWSMRMQETVCLQVWLVGVCLIMIMDDNDSDDLDGVG